MVEATDLQSFTIVNDSEGDIKQLISVDPIYIHLLPGEKFICFHLLNYGCRFGLTNYRIIIIFDSTQSQSCKDTKSRAISIPIGLIYHIEYYGLVCLTIITKIARRFSLTFPNVELCEETIRKIRTERQRMPFSLSFAASLSGEPFNSFILDSTNPGDDWLEEKQTIESEFKRLEYPEGEWRISNVNEDQKICASYPSYHIVLRHVEDELVIKMAEFRAKNRFMSVVYRHKSTGTVILRSGQPMTGMGNCRNSYDERYIREIIKQCPAPRSDVMVDGPGMIPRLKILDARSYTSAQLNRVHNGGMECEAYYPGCSIEFLNIPNMHSVRSSFEALSACLEQTSTSFYSTLERSNWLQLVLQLLECAHNTMKTLVHECQSILIHCSDGWDRTPQLASLAQIIIDPFYRTMQGFKTLIRREWIFFGHKFNERNALWPNEPGREFSPVFLQWLDCVFQMQQQFPDHFEFNELFLMKLALHTSSGLFGTFNKTLFQQTQRQHYSGRLASVWNLLQFKEQRCFLNPLYNHTDSSGVMQLRLHMSHIKLWTALYIDALSPHCVLADIASCDSSSSEHRQLGGSSVTVPAAAGMVNSMMIVRETEEHEDTEDDTSDFAVALQSQVNPDIISSIHESAVTTPANSFFRVVCVTDKESEDPVCELVDIEGQPKIDYSELGFDGLYHRKDLVNVYSNMYRQNRRILQRNIDRQNRKMTRLADQLRQLQHGKSTAKIDIEINGDDSSSEETNDDALDNDTVLIDRMVLWVPNHAVTSCIACSREFGLFYRRHHCRSCGQIFCKSCSAHLCSVPKENISWAVRVCDKCFKTLSNDTDSGIKTSDKRHSSGSYFARLF